MASNSFGTLFRITTFGESHGKMIGVVIDGCPAGLAITEEEVALELKRRAPGGSAYTSPRKEADQPQIVSGVLDGKTTGTPIAILIENRDHNSAAYEALKKIYRPGHANFTYMQKYGRFDYRGGGRASARETACRVAAGAVAKKLLAHFNVEVSAFLQQMGEVIVEGDELWTREAISDSELFCPDKEKEMAMKEQISCAIAEGDSYGGVVQFCAKNAPVGLGDPIYEKIEAKLASAMLSLPASKGFAIGEGFEASLMMGSEHNDSFMTNERGVAPKSNRAGGTLGGITTGLPLIGRVAFKPTSTIRKEQKSVTTSGKETVLTLPEGSRHDPCVAIRAVPVVEAMVALVLADALLLQRCTQI